jgi:hypothetical protein
MPVRTGIAALALAGAMAFAQTKSQPDVEVPMVLTVADHLRHQPPSLKREDVSIQDAIITNWVPIRDGDDLEIFVLIDDAANVDFDSKLQELRRFVILQPAAVSIGVAYIRDGTLQIVENPTRDRSKAVRALRAPLGSGSANPYCALSDLIRHWPRRSLRRDIVMVSPGIKDSATAGAVCVNVETAITDAERVGIAVYALYSPTADSPSGKWPKIDSEEINHVCYETGGEAYYLTRNPLESIDPLLADITEHLAHQYFVKFLIAPGPESGFQPIYVNSGLSSVELMVPESVWVPMAIQPH